MKKAESFTEIATKLESEVTRLQHFETLFDKAVKLEFGYTSKQLHEIVKKHEFYEKRRAERQGQSAQI